MTISQKKIVAAVEGAIDDLEQLIVRLQDFFDERTEQWQEGERGQEAEETISQLEDYLTQLRDAAPPDL